MLKNISRARLIGAWCAAAIVLGACSAGAAITISHDGLLLVACLMPPAIMLLVWRRPPPITVAELLYAVNKSSKEARP